VKRVDSAEVWSRLLPLIATGASLPAALRQLPEPRPSLWWAKMSIRNDPDLAERYRAAQELRADALADEIVALADEPMPAGLQGTEASAWVQQMRLRVDARKWTASRLFPRQWGDRVEVGIDVSAQISIASALEAANARVDRLQQVEIVEGEPSRARIG
jgi:hypothetical protein